MLRATETASTRSCHRPNPPFRPRVDGLLAVCLLLAAAAPAWCEDHGATTGDEFDQGYWVEQMPDILSQRERPAVFNRLLGERLDELLPQLMRETGIDMWLVLNREYVEDPVYFTLVPQPSHAARRTTMLVFHDKGEGEGVERLTVNRYPFGSLYESAWSGGDLDEQWKGLAEVIAARDPQVIGVNVSRDWPVADGLTHGLHERLMEVLSPELRSRVRSAEDLVVRWFETRSASELEIYPQIVAMARKVIREAFSNQVITPGATTADEVAWYIAERFAELELPIWFQPSVDVQRAGQECDLQSPFCGVEGDTVIRRGDVIHTDVGVCYLGLCTDTQEMGYILQLGETEAPRALQQALAQGNRWQDILTGNFETGRTGNEILARTGEQCTDEGLICSTYTHPIGNHGHGVGPTIGMWDNQGPTIPRGDWKLYPDTAFSIEGNTRTPLEAWGGQYVVIKLEQDAVWDGERVWYIAGRQTEWHLVR
ncbi:MAG: M24 family metallopeptidase [Acidobacteria bacterium]|nr:MAG: M24 family metallopeptidase [Acidobacteriota bacterium]REJ99472.1 MAG: M24 family metallopeptidase [Acidobacteriota bacterium]